MIVKKIFVHFFFFRQAATRQAAARLTNLPPDMLGKISSHLNHRSAAQLAQTSRTAHSATAHNMTLKKQATRAQRVNALANKLHTLSGEGLAGVHSLEPLVNPGMLRGGWVPIGQRINDQHPFIIRRLGLTKQQPMVAVLQKPPYRVEVFSWIAADGQKDSTIYIKRDHRIVYSYDLATKRMDFGVSFADEEERDAVQLLKKKLRGH